MIPSKIKGAFLVAAAAPFYYIGVLCKKVWRVLAFMVASFQAGFADG